MRIVRLNWNISKNDVNLFSTVKSKDIVNKEKYIKHLEYEKNNIYLSRDAWYTLSQENDRIVHLKRPEEIEEVAQNLTTPSVLIVMFDNTLFTPRIRGDHIDKIIHSHPMIIAVFAKNALYQSDRLKSMPLGPKWQVSSHKLFGEDKMNRVNDLMELGATSPSGCLELFKTPKKHLVTMTWMANTNKERKDLYKFINFKINKMGKVNNYEYLKGLRESRFVISPPGKGRDCHRHWEALLMGACPIILSSDVDSVFDDLPVWLVKSYDEVTEDAVVKKEREIMSKEYNFEKLFKSYWEKKILSLLK